MGSRVIGTGAYLPRKIIKNNFFHHLVDLKYSEHLDDLFNGFQERRHSSPDETSVFMGVESAKNAMKAAKVSPDDIDFVVWSSFACEHALTIGTGLAMRELGIRNAAHCSIDVGCSSFLSQLHHADMLIETGRAKTVLIITVVNWINRFVDTSRYYGYLGDGAAAVVVQQHTQSSLLSIRERVDIDNAGIVSLYQHWATGKKECIQFNTTPESRVYVLGEGATAVARDCILDGRKQNVKPTWTIFSQIGLKPLKVWSRATRGD